MANQIKEYDFLTTSHDLGFHIGRITKLISNVPANRRSTPHLMKFFVILLITEGKGRHQVDFETYNYDKGSVLLIGKEQVQAWIDNKNLDGYFIIFEEDFLYANQIKFKDLTYSFPYNSGLFSHLLKFENEENYQALLSLADYMLKEYSLPKTAATSEILQCLLRALLLKLKENTGREQNEIKKDSIETFIRFQRLLDKKINSTRHAADYCEMLNVSHKKLNLICKSLTKMTIKSFIDHEVILKAKRLLSKPEMNISEIAYHVGFEERTNFTKFFRKHENMTPKEFRKQINNA